MTNRNCKISKNQTHNRCYSDYMMYMLMHTCLLLFVRSRHFLIIFKSRNCILQYEISVWIYLYLSLSSLTFKGFSHSFISIISPVLFWAFSWRFELPCFPIFNLQSSSEEDWRINQNIGKDCHWKRRGKCTKNGCDYRSFLILIN